MQIEPAPEIQEDQDVFNGDTDMFDAVINDTIRMNLTSRFDANVSTTSNQTLITDHEATMPATQQHQSPVTPTHTSESSSPNGPTSPPTPLTPRNNITTGSAGAASK